jgi:hypothetical protein
MNKPVPKFSWDKIDAERKNAGFVEDDAPAEAFSVYQYALRYQTSISAASDQISAMLRRCALKKGKKIMPASDGRRLLMNVYWPA